MTSRTALRQPTCSLHAKCPAIRIAVVVLVVLLGCAQGRVLDRSPNCTECWLQPIYWQGGDVVRRCHRFCQPVCPAKPEDCTAAARRREQLIKHQPCNWLQLYQAAVAPEYTILGRVSDSVWDFLKYIGTRKCGRRAALRLVLPDGHGLVSHWSHRTACFWQLDDFLPRTGHNSDQGNDQPWGGVNFSRMQWLYISHVYRENLLAAWQIEQLGCVQV